MDIENEMLGNVIVGVTVLFCAFVCLVSLYDARKKVRFHHQPGRQRDDQAREKASGHFYLVLFFTVPFVAIAVLFFLGPGISL